MKTIFGNKAGSQGYLDKRGNAIGVALFHRYGFDGWLASSHLHPEVTGAAR